MLLCLAAAGGWPAASDRPVAIGFPAAFDWPVAFGLNQWPSGFGPPWAFVLSLRLP